MFKNNTNKIVYAVPRLHVKIAERRDVWESITYALHIIDYTCKDFANVYVKFYWISNELHKY